MRTILKNLRQQRIFRRPKKSEPMQMLLWTYLLHSKKHFMRAKTLSIFISTTLLIRYLLIN